MVYPNNHSTTSLKMNAATITNTPTHFCVLSCPIQPNIKVNIPMNIIILAAMSKYDLNVLMKDVSIDIAPVASSPSAKTKHTKQTLIKSANDTTAKIFVRGLVNSDPPPFRTYVRGVFLSFECDFVVLHFDYLFLFYFNLFKVILIPYSP